uniref:Uncharacterized protein n=1 Tax=Timema cristinae TaxID=61476 RepID=A0A7R9CV20_TIMCR|nr:unnamed protein product [Timema cristinae]
MQHLLKDLKQEYHTYSFPRDKPVHVVVKGLPPIMLMEDLQQELVWLSYPVTHVRQFTTNTPSTNATQTFTLLPTFQDDTDEGHTARRRRRRDINQLPPKSQRGITSYVYQNH